MANLPLQTMPFIGRADEIAAIVQQLADPSCCLLTLVGPGGMGKTRLAIEVAKHIAQAQPPLDGIYFVDLQAVQSHDLLVTALANSVGILISGGTDPRTQLIMYLQERNSLLLLDNFEQLLDSVDLLADMLKAAPDLKLLVTSREALNIQEEWVWRVGGLQIPIQQESPIESYSAVQLFVERARRSRQNFSLIGQEAFVTRTCQLVEGMPLALELAASWTKALSCAEIVNEIQRGLDFLTTNKRNVLERHQSMQAVFDHSWHLLTDAERLAFPKLSVFRGGFRREAAEQVAGASLAVLVGLVDKSFLRLSADGRYDIHELIRQFSDELLQAVPDAKKIAQYRHCAYYADFLYQRQMPLRGSTQAAILDEISAELDNIRVTWEWAVEHNMIEMIHQSMHSFYVFCHIRSQAVEGERLCSLAIARFDHDESATLAYLLLARINLFNLNGKIIEVEQFTRAIRMARTFRVEELISLHLSVYFWCRDRLIANKQYDDQLYEQLCLECLDIFRTQGQLWSEAYMYFCLDGICLFTDRFSEAEKYGHKCLDGFIQLDDSWGCAYATFGLAIALEASERYQESLKIWQEHQDYCGAVGDWGGVVFALAKKAEVAWKLQDYIASKHYIAQAIKSHLEMGSQIAHIREVFRSLIAVFISENRYERAAELSSFLQQHAGTVSALDTMQTARKNLETLVEKLPPEIYQQAVERGKKLHFRIILEQLLDELSDSSPATTQSQQANSLHQATPNQSLFDPLTDRELEVLRLLAAGRSNREIAQALVLALGTVKWYISEIYSKLGVASRTQAIARASELNMLS